MRYTSARFYVFDTSRLLKSLVSELLFGNEGSGVETSARYDNSSVVVRARAINSVSNGRRLNSFLDSNRVEIYLTEWLLLAVKIYNGRQALFKGFLNTGRNGVFSLPPNRANGCPFFVFI